MQHWMLPTAKRFKPNDSNPNRPWIPPNCVYSIPSQPTQPTTSYHQPYNPYHPRTPIYGYNYRTHQYNALSHPPFNVYNHPSTRTTSVTPQKRLPPPSSSMYNSFQQIQQRPASTTTINSETYSNTSASSVPSTNNVQRNDKETELTQSNVLYIASDKGKHFGAIRVILHQIHGTPNHDALPFGSSSNPIHFNGYIRASPILSYLSGCIDSASKTVRTYALTPLSTADNNAYNDLLRYTTKTLRCHVLDYESKIGIICYLIPPKLYHNTYIMKENKMVNFVELLKLNDNDGYTKNRIWIISVTSNAKYDTLKMKQCVSLDSDTNNVQNKLNNDDKDNKTTKRNTQHKHKHGRKQRAMITIKECTPPLMDLKKTLKVNQCEKENEDGFSDMDISLDLSESENDDMNNGKEDKNTDKTETEYVQNNDEGCDTLSNEDKTSKTTNNNTQHKHIDNINKMVIDTNHSSLSINKQINDNHDIQVTDINDHNTPNVESKAVYAVDKNDETEGEMDLKNKQDKGSTEKKMMDVPMNERSKNEKEEEVEQRMIQLRIHRKNNISKRLKQRLSIAPHSMINCEENKQINETDADANHQVNESTMRKGDINKDHSTTDIEYKPLCGVDNNGDNNETEDKRSINTNELQSNIENIEPMEMDIGNEDIEVYHDYTVIDELETDLNIMRKEVSEWNYYGIIYWLNRVNGGCFRGLKYMNLRKHIRIGRVRGNQLCHLNDVTLNMIGIYDVDDIDLILDAVHDLISNDDFNNVSANCLLSDCVPIMYCDRISFELMSDPVMIKSNGNIYERKSIEKYVMSYGKDPLTQKSVQMDEIVVLASLKKTIDRWKQHNFGR